MDTLAIGSDLRGYRLEGILGQGGFGIVYRAKHQELGIQVAIKEYCPIEISARRGSNIVPRSPACEHNYNDGLIRFKEEASRLIEFQLCPNIVSCRDFFRLNGTAYLVMEYVNGLPLSELVRGREEQHRPFEENDLLTVILPLLDSLTILHGADVLHRDIKPSNVLIRYSDGRPILIDFGAAKQGVAERTKSFAPYTPGYAAFEQIGDGTLGSWTDIYGLGALMWRIMSNGCPSSPVAVERRVYDISRGKPDPLNLAQEMGKGRFSESILSAIDKSLAINEDERVQDCIELCRLLKGEVTGQGSTESTCFRSLLKGTHLHWEAWAGRHHRVLELVETGSNVDARALDEMTPLHWAAWTGKNRCISTLIDCGANIDAQDRWGRTPLHRSLRSGQRNSIVSLTEAGADLTIRDKHGWGVLVFALLSGLPDVLEYLVAAGADVESKDALRRSPLHFAASRRCSSKLATLIKAGARVNSLDQDSRTPLHVAVKYGHRQNVQVLVRSGANVDWAPGRGGLSPLQLAAKSRNGFRVIEALVLAGAEVDQTDRIGNTPLCTAVWNGHEENVSALIDSGADVNFADSEDFFAPLHLAPQFRDESKIIVALVRAGADVDARNSAGKTALHYAARNGHTKSVCVLIKLGADINLHETDTGLSPLHLAAIDEELIASVYWRRSAPNAECINALIAAGADVTAKSTGNRWFSRSTPLHWAALTGFTEGIGALLAANADIHAVAGFGASPLHWAALKYEPGAILALIEGGADLNARATGDATPLHWLAAARSPLCLRGELLTNRLFTPTRHDRSRFYPLAKFMHHWRGRGDIESAVTHLVQTGVDIEARTTEGATPLHWAVQSSVDGPRITKALIAAGANVGRKLKDGRTPLHLAPDPETIECLVLGGADLEAKDDSGNTPLHSASGWWGLSKDGIDFLTRETMTPDIYGDGVEELIKAGAEVGSSNSLGMTPLHVAALYHNYAAAKALIAAGAEVNRVVRKFYSATALLLVFYSGYGIDRPMQDQDAAILKLLLEAGAKPDMTFEQSFGPIYGGQHLLHLAVKRGTVPVVSVLAEAVENIDIKDSNGAVALSLACEGDPDKGKIDVLLDQGASVGDWIASCENPLHKVSLAGSTKGIARLVGSGVDVNGTDGHGQTPLHWAAGFAQVSSVEALLQLGADVESRDKHGLTALHSLSEVSESLLRIGEHESDLQRRVRSTFSCLLDAGCCPNVLTSTSRESPLHLVAASSGRSIVEMYEEDAYIDKKAITMIRGIAKLLSLALVECGARVDARDGVGRTPVHVAALWGSSECIGVLVSAGANVHATFENNWTLLHVAVEHHAGRLGVVDHEVCPVATESIQALIRGGIDVNTSDRRGCTPMHLACEFGLPETIKGMRDAGADTDVRNDAGQTPWAILRTRLETYVVDVMIHDLGVKAAEVIHCLIRKGVDVNVRDVENLTLRHRVNQGGVSAEVESILVGYIVDRALRENLDRVDWDCLRSELKSQLIDDAQPFLEIYIQAAIRGDIDINGQDISGGTPLHLACKIGKPEIMTSIIDAGADKYRKDRSGRFGSHYLEDRADLGWLGYRLPVREVYDRLDPQRSLFD